MDRIEARAPGFGFRKLKEGPSEALPAIGGIDSDVADKSSSIDNGEDYYPHDDAVAFGDGGIVGVVVLTVEDEGLLIDNVAVDPSYRGKGLGRALLEFAEAEARRTGFDSIHLYTHEKMTENLAIYSKIGYIEYDRRSQGDFSLVYMRKHLG